MKERKGTVGRITGVAEGLAAAVKRSRQDRVPRVVLYDRAGHPQTLPPDHERHERIVETARRLVSLAAGGPVEPPEEEAGAEADAEAADGAADGESEAARADADEPAVVVPAAPAGRDGGARR